MPSLRYSPALPVAPGRLLSIVRGAKDEALLPPLMLPRALPLLLFTPSPASPCWSEDGVPCLFLQASFMRGGVILGTAWHHQVAEAWLCDIFLSLLAEKTRAALGRHMPHL